MLKKLLFFVSSLSGFATIGMELPQRLPAENILQALKKNDVNELRVLIRKGEKIKKWQLPSLLALPKNSWLESMPILMTECPMETEEEINKEVKSLKELAIAFILRTNPKVSSYAKNIPAEVLRFIMQQADQDHPDQLKILKQMMENGRDNKNNEICSVAPCLIKTATIPKARELILMMAEYVPNEQKMIFFGPVSKNTRIDWYARLVSDLISILVNRQIAIRNNYIEQFKAVNRQASRIVRKTLWEPDFVFNGFAFIPKFDDVAYEAIKTNEATCYKFCLDNLLAMIKKSMEKN